MYGLLVLGFGAWGPGSIGVQGSRFGIHKEFKFRFKAISFRLSDTLLSGWCKVLWLFWSQAVWRLTLCQ